MKRGLGLLLLCVLFLVGCSEVLGLGDYTNADGGAGADRVGLVDAGCGLGLACAEAAPSGWSGPTALWSETGMPPPIAPACTGDYGQTFYDGHGELEAPTAKCDCACVNLTGVTCGPATITRYNNMNCTAQCVNPTVIVSAGACANTTPCGGNWDLGGSSPSGGSCTPQPSAVIPPAAWKSAGRVCGASVAPARGACDPGTVCMPVPSFPFEARFCIVHTGDVACPGDRYKNKRVFYDGYVDTRDCPANQCQCGAAAGSDCNAATAIVTYDATSCAGNVLDTFTGLPKTCQHPTGSTKSVKLNAIPTGGMCPATVVMPSGMATPQNPTTVCCASL